MWVEIASVISETDAANDDSREVAFQKVSKVISAAESKTGLLAVVDENLPAQVVEMIRATEDYVAQWCFSDNAGGIKPSSTALAKHCHDQQFVLIGHVKAQQKKM